MYRKEVSILFANISFTGSSDTVQCVMTASWQSQNWLPRKLL